MKPRQVSWAVALLWGSLTLGIVNTLLDWRFLGSVAAPGFTFGVAGAVFGLMALLVAMISAGRNWARITFLVLFLVGAVPYVLNLIAMFGRSAVTGGLSLVQMVLQLTALCLIFESPGASWFRRRA